MTTLKLALWYIKTKSYIKFELNMSKHVGEKRGKGTLLLQKLIPIDDT